MTGDLIGSAMIVMFGSAFFGLLANTTTGITLSHSGPSVATITALGQASGGGKSLTSATTTVFGSNTGNLAVCTIEALGTTAPTSVVENNGAGNTGVLEASGSVGATNSVFIYFINLTTTGSNVVVVSFAAATTFVITLEEYSGTVLHPGTIGTANTGNSQAATASLVTSTTGSWVVGAASANGPNLPLSPGSGTTQRSAIGTVGGAGATNVAGDLVDNNMAVSSGTNVALNVNIPTSAEPWVMVDVELLALQTPGVTVNANTNITATIGLVPLIRLIPFVFGALILLAVFAVFEPRFPGGL